MYCGSCKTEFDREPLIVYHGEWYCPFCLQSLFPKPGIVRNFENIRKYLASERLFQEGWLLQGDTVALKKALRLARESAYEHNPNALIAMGYYHEKNYLNPFVSETERIRSAVQYYKAVACYDVKFRTFFAPQLEVPDTDLKSGDLQELTKIALSNLCALVGETTADAVENVFRMTKTTVEQKLKEILGMETGDAYEAEPERFPSAEEILTEIRPDEVLFGFEKADARLLRELGSFNGLENDRELNADNFLSKRNLTVWIMRKDKTWQETEAGNKNQFIKAAESGGDRFVVAYMKNGLGKIADKNKGVKVQFSRNVFDRYRKTLVQNGMLYDFRRSDLIIAAHRIREKGDVKRDETFGAVLELLAKGGL